MQYMETGNDNSYTASGYDEHFQRQVVPPIPTTAYGTPFDFASQFSGFAANQISTGSFKSNNGHVVFDLDSESLSINDGTTERVRLGKLIDGSYGISLNDANGNNLNTISGNNNIIQSGDGSVKLDFNAAQFTVTDASGNVVVLIGKQVGGF